jgi:hypothetical protein
MVAVLVAGALMAVGFEAARLSQRARDSQRLATWHAAMRDLCLGEAWEYRYAYDHRGTNDDESRLVLMTEDHERTLARYHDAMAAKYRWAARYPWLPVEPNSPKPN